MYSSCVRTARRHVAIVAACMCESRMHIIGRVEIIIIFVDHQYILIVSDEYNFIEAHGNDLK
jgi:hypothetical protein